MYTTCNNSGPLSHIFLIISITELPQKSSWSIKYVTLSSTTFLLYNFHSDKYLSSYTRVKLKMDAETHVVPNVKHTLHFTDFNQN